MRGWSELSPVARQLVTQTRASLRSRGATRSVRALRHRSERVTASAVAAAPQRMVAGKESLLRNAEKAFSAAVKGPMRSMSNRPNQTRVVRLDAFGCSTVRLSAGTHPLSLVDFRDVRIGTDQKVQRCRAHKLRNVLDYLPKDDKPQVKSLLRAAWKLDADKGIARIKKLAAWLDQKYPQAAASLLEGVEEYFTINRLNIPPALHRCLATTNIIESPHAGVRIQTRRVAHWQNAKMVLRCMASAFLRTEKRFKRIMGHKDLWALEAILNPTATAGSKVA